MRFELVKGKSKKAFFFLQGYAISLLQGSPRVRGRQLGYMGLRGLAGGGAMGPAPTQVR